MPYTLKFFNSKDNHIYQIGPINAYIEATDAFEKLTQKPEIAQVELFSSLLSDNEPMRFYRSVK